MSPGVHLSHAARLAFDGQRAIVAAVQHLEASGVEMTPESDLLEGLAVRHAAALRFVRAAAGGVVELAPGSIVVLVSRRMTGGSGRSPSVACNSSSRPTPSATAVAVCDARPVAGRVTNNAVPTNMTKPTTREIRRIISALNPLGATRPRLIARQPALGPHERMKYSIHGRRYRLS